METGIDKISFYTAQYYIDMKTLADVRGVDRDKYYVGIGQERMSVAPPDEDVITLAASAAKPLLEGINPSDIELLLFATETGIDQSKAAGIYVHRLLGLSHRCRVVELKQACYSCTAGLQMARSLLAAHPDKKALIIASDVARYELDSPGEATQGCAAIAMLVSANPRIMAIDEESGYYTEDVMDFWRPNYRDEALVDGKFSTKQYIATLEHTWKQYQEQTGRSFGDFKHFCYHVPFSKMAEKAHQRLARANNVKLTPELFEQQIGRSLIYNRITGNSYTASLYVGLTSLLDSTEEDLGNQRIGLFSYGSGCVAEFFSGVVIPGYKDHLLSSNHLNILDNRAELTYQQYEDIYHFGVPKDGGDHSFPLYKTGPYRLAGIKDHKRLYETVS